MFLLKLIRFLTYKAAAIKRIIYSLHPDIYIGKGTVIESGALLRVRSGGKIVIGNNCYIAKGAQLLTHGGNIVIGSFCSINPYTVLYGQGGLKIGDGVRIAAHCCIVPSNHNFSDPKEFIYRQGATNKGILIKEDVWLGAGVKVLDGVTIEKGCVLGANAVITKSTEEYGVYVGIPAKLIKKRI